MTSSPVSSTQVRTLTPQMSSPRWMGALGHVNGLKYSYNWPGGCKDASWTLDQPPQWRSDALDPGRIVECWRGSSKIWEGILDEPVSGANGWSITAHGNGTYGNTVMTDYTAYNLDNPLNRAINRGLRWTKGTLGSIGWQQTPAENDSVSITDFLNGATLQAGLGWYIDVRQKNLLTISAPPSVSSPNRLLISTIPVSRTLSAGLNTLWYAYVSATLGSQTVTTYANVLNQAAINKHGPLEQQIDFTSAGYMPSSQAQSNAQNLLNQYIRANFGGPFTVQHGQLMTMGGTAIDLGTDYAGTVCRLLVTDGSYGGEVTANPVSFVVGEYEYDDDSQTATITPWQSYKMNLQTLLTARVPEFRQ